MQSNLSTYVENTSSHICSTVEELCLAGNDMINEGMWLSNSTTGSCGQLIPNLSTLDSFENVLTNEKF